MKTIEVTDSTLEMLDEMVELSGKSMSVVVNSLIYEGMLASLKKNNVEVVDNKLTMPENKKMFEPDNSDLYG